MRALIACGLAALAACHDLPDLGSCGNGIVEQAHGEACDEGGETATCTASCELKCTDSAVIASYVEVGPDRNGTAAYCPGASYRCGSDRVCRAPSGRFAPLAPSVAFDVTAPPVASDVDNDGLVDLVGTSMTRIYVRFGSTTGTPLGDVVIQDAPFADAPYAVFDLPANRPGADQPGTVMAVPTEGVALLRSDGDRFTPELDLPFQVPRSIGEVLGIVVRDPDPAIGDVPIAVQSQSATPSITLARVAVGLPPIPIQLLPPCVGSGNESWHTVDVQAAPDRRSFVVVTQRDSAAQPAAQPWHVCRYTASGTSWALADLELPPPTPSSIALADLDGDPCLELVVHGDGAPGLAMLDASGAGCGFAAATAPLLIAGPGAALLGAGQIVAGGVDELVLADGVYRACAGPADCGASPAGTFVRVAGPTFPTRWSAAALTDLNGDGALDVVAGRVRATATAPIGDPGVDIVRGGAIPNVYAASTSEPVTRLIAGDFDGDRLGDVAMIESAPPGDRVTVLFGTQEATAGTPIAMSPFGGRLRIGRASEIHWLPTTRGSDGIDDLVVIQTGMPGGNAAPAAGLLVGDAARLMTTPHFPPTATTTTAVRPLGAVAAGRFGSDDLEILAVTGPQAQLYNVMANSWAPPVDLGMQLDQPVAALRGGPGPTRAAARGDGNDVVVFSLRGAVTACRVTAAGTPIELRGIDVDGDGIDELAVSFSDGDGQRTLQLFRTTGCPLEPVAIDALAGCVDAVDTGNGLVAICRDPDASASPVMNDPAARVLVAIARTDGTFVAARLAPIAGDARFVTAGDFDGDGVLDVAVGVHRGSGVGVQLLRQCPAHDTRACPGAAADRLSSPP